MDIEDARTSASAKVVLPLPGKPTRINSTCRYERGIYYWPNILLQDIKRTYSLLTARYPQSEAKGCWWQQKSFHKSERYFGPALFCGICTSRSLAGTGMVVMWSRYI